MKRLSSNAYLLLCCLVINSITTVFIYSFLLAFVLDVSQNSIINVALFYLTLHIATIVLSWLLAPFFKRFNKTFSLKIGVIFKFLFVLLVVLLYDDIITYIYLIAILDAFSETLFWGGANPLQPMVVKKNTLTYYLSLIKVFSTVIAIVIPIIIGVLIDSFGIFVISVMMLVMVSIQIVLSIFIKQEDKEVNTKLSYKGFINSPSLDRYGVKHIYFNQLLFGFCSNVSMLVLYYTVIIFGTNTSIGIFSTITAIISIVLLTIFNYNKKFFINYKMSIVYSLMICIGIALIILIPNKITLTLLYVFWNISIVIPETITNEKRLNIVNHKSLIGYNIENVTISEVFLDTGRVIGEILILCMGIINNRLLDIIVLCIVTIIVIIYYFHYTFIHKYELYKETVPSEKNNA